MFNELGEFGRSPPAGALNPTARAWAPTRIARSDSPVVVEDLETGSPTAADGWAPWAPAITNPEAEAASVAAAAARRPRKPAVDLLGALRGARATRWATARAAFLACRDVGAGRGEFVTPASLRAAFRDQFSLAVDEASARHVAFALGGEGEGRCVDYAAFAAAIDSEATFSAARHRSSDAAAAARTPAPSPNPLVAPPLPPLPPPAPFDPVAADGAFRARLLSRHEGIARSWIKIHPRGGRRDLADGVAGELSREDLGAALRAVLGPGAIGGDADVAAVFSLYDRTGAGAISFAAFAARFADAGARRPVLSEAGRNYVYRRAAAALPVEADDAYLGGWFGHVPPARAGPTWKRGAY